MRAGFLFSWHMPFTRQGRREWDRVLFKHVVYEYEIVVYKCDPGIRFLHMEKRYNSFADIHSTSFYIVVRSAGTKEIIFISFL